MSEKKKVIRVLLIVVLVLAAAGGYTYYRWSSGFISTNDAQITVDGPTVPITVAFGGRLKSWLVKPNARVNQGQIIGEESNQSVLAANSGLIPMVQGNSALAQRLAEREVVRSPISGLIVQCNASVGQGVQPGMVLAQVANENHLQVTANIYETKIRKVRVGQKVDVTVDGLPGTVLHGQVARIGEYTLSVFSLIPNVTAASGSYTKVAQRVPVVINFQDPQLAKQTLVPGMNAEVKVYLR
ncbi:putative multidrug resistance protein EmrK [Peptococcaceae bacterium CEB3]|nr:putative multidrug resistance protein EmrK [Peptococcaceae bacterium CEB3]